MGGLWSVLLVVTRSLVEGVVTRFRSRFSSWQTVRDSSEFTMELSSENVILSTIFIGVLLTDEEPQRAEEILVADSRMFMDACYDSEGYQGCVAGVWVIQATGSFEWARNQARILKERRTNLSRKRFDAIEQLTGE